MLDYKSIIRLKKLGLSHGAIAARLGCKWESVQRIVTRCENEWGDLCAVPEDLTNEEIADTLFQTRKSVDTDYFQPDCERILEKQRKGFLRNELWVEYCAESAKAGRKAYQLSRFNEIVSTFKANNDISFTQKHAPGIDSQVDWAGDRGHIIDSDTGEIIDIHVFVMTLPYSGYFYAEGFLNEDMNSWLTGHIHAYAFFGGVPQFTIPDNCATAVDRTHFDERGILNTRYVEFLNHYGTVPKPARVRKPKDKGHVERHVGIVEKDIIRVMNQLDIYTLKDFNDILLRKVISRNARAYSKKLGSRTEIFESEERRELLPLPTMNYRSYVEKEATVWRDYHIQFECAFYSVPSNYIGHKVKVRASSDEVQILNNQNRLIAQHHRAVRKWERLTDPSHVPDYGTVEDGAYSTPEILNWARKFGPFTEKWIRAELGRFKYEVQAYRPATTVLRLLNRHSSVAERTSEMAIESNIFTVKGFRGILSAQERKHEEETAPEPDLNSLFCSHDGEVSG